MGRRSGVRRRGRRQQPAGQLEERPTGPLAQPAGVTEQVFTNPKSPQTEEYYSALRGRRIRRTFLPGIFREDFFLDS